MLIKIYESRNYYRVKIGSYDPVIKFSSPGEAEIDSGSLRNIAGNMEVSLAKDSINIQFDLDPSSHVLGLGERAFGIDRKRKKLISVNKDPGGYVRGVDPIYLPLPFFLQLTDGACLGVFVNHPGKVLFDFGVETYNKSTVTVFDSGCEVFIFKSSSIKDVVRSFIELTGKPFLPPYWSIGHAISRYTYYPASSVLEIIEKYQKFVPVEAVYLDIHYMDRYKLFTWDPAKFGNGREFVEKVHDRGTKIIPIIDPSIKSDQSYSLFVEGMGNYIETPNSDIYHGKMWPGDSVFLDFLNEKSRDLWKKYVTEFHKTGVDGIWLDMNEPTILSEDHLLDANAIHHLDDGSPIIHEKVRNAYPYFQAKATFEALSSVSREPFVLSRSGYAGIQKYAAVWTGDNKSSWDDVKLQISVVTSLSISGVTVVGCDLGGFFSDSDPEMLAAYYRMALFFPLYRNHKTINGNDQEVFLMPSKFRDDIMASVKLRYDFMDYIYSILYNSHSEGVPAVVPLPYEFPLDGDSYYAEDQYMLGTGLLYAPQIYQCREEREVYLPEGNWLEFWSRKVIKGSAYYRTKEKFPVYIKENSCVVYRKKIIVFGKGKFTLYISGQVVTVDSDGTHVEVTPRVDGYTAEVYS